jgi:Zinc finger C-x8-C-x5-C-x3-H type (and similar)
MNCLSISSFQSCRCLLFYPQVNCPFYYKIGACRHGDRCSRQHHKPPFSQTILMSHMFQNPASAVVAAGGNPELIDQEAANDEVRVHLLSNSVPLFIGGFSTTVRIRSTKTRCWYADVERHLFGQCQWHICVICCACANYGAMYLHIAAFQLSVCHKLIGSFCVMLLCCLCSLKTSMRKCLKS